MAIPTYTPTAWVNDSAPARSADNLNKQETGIKNATDEAIALDSRVTDNTNDIVALQTTPDYYDLTPVTPPAHNEGRIFYDDTTKTLSVMSDIIGTTLNVGQETYIRVYNNTGVTITNGQAVKLAGVHLGVPSVDLAIADTYSSARTLGLATADILSGAFGYTTTEGGVGDVPMNQGGETWAVGDTLYVSDTTPGELTNVLPPIASVLGVVLTTDGVTGTVYARVDNLLTLPPIGGWMKEIATTIAPGAGYANFTGFADTEVSAGITADGVVGTYTFDIPGTYETSVSVSFSGITGQNNGSIIAVQMWNATTASSLFEYNVIVGRNDTVASGTMITQDDYNVDDVLVCRYREVSGGVGAAVSVDNISFLVKSILIR